MDEVYPSADLHKLVDLDPDIPEAILPRLSKILRDNIEAFGVDGRLGKVEAKVTVPLKEGALPISIPTYQTSPANRAVVDKQMDIWFQQRVIEPSKSPWAAPAFVVYRGGKPRVVIDY